ncbi:MAG: hypothetical protein ABR583_00215 [Gaiellaceae bacterium]
MAETTQATGSRDGELAKVAGWRLHVLIESGYPLDVAERIAQSEADLHRAVELITHGCPAEVAEQILC